MTNKAASTNHKKININDVLSRIIFLASCLFVNGCETTKVLTDAIVVGCGTGTIYLSDWHAGVPDNSVQYDPMGGYQFAYWIDDANNVCHGNPDINGQPGIAVIKAFKPQANELARNQSFVTLEQLKTFQEIPVPLDNYAGSGLHFVQFFNDLARGRNDGKAMRFPGLNGTVSIPNVIDVGKKSCIFPLVSRVIDLPVPLPADPLHQPDTHSQDPEMCKVRAMPREVTMSVEDRKKYDAGNFAQGTKIFEVQ